MARPKQDLWNRLARKSIRDPDTGCILWQGATTYGGYPLTEHEGKTKTVARLVYQQLHPDLIGAGDQVSHKCNQKLCINPDHLFISRKKRDAI